MNIIDDINKLVEMDKFELDELLLDEKYNKANLRELVRRLISVVKDYKVSYKYQVNVKKELEEKLLKLKSYIEEIDI